MTAGKGRCQTCGVTFIRDHASEMYCSLGCEPLKDKAMVVYYGDANDGINHEYILKTWMRILNITDYMLFNLNTTVTFGDFHRLVSSSSLVLTCGLFATKVVTPMVNFGRVHSLPDIPPPKRQDSPDLTFRELTKLKTLLRRNI